MIELGKKPHILVIKYAKKRKTLHGLLAPWCCSNVANDTCQHVLSVLSCQHVLSVPPCQHVLAVPSCQHVLPAPSCQSLFQADCCSAVFMHVDISAILGPCTIHPPVLSHDEHVQAVVRVTLCRPFREPKEGLHRGLPWDCLALLLHLGLRLRQTPPMRLGTTTGHFDPWKDWYLLSQQLRH